MSLVSLRCIEVLIFYFHVVGNDSLYVPVYVVLSPIVWLNKLRICHLEYSSKSAEIEKTKSPKYSGT